MLYYPVSAVTYKNINKFSYEIYNNISINFMKNQNDSSTSFRLLDALTSSWRELADDFPYLLNFSLNNLDFVQIDRINKFSIDNILSLDIQRTREDVICNSNILGYSKYTNSIYGLQYVENKDDFIRHSYPCDVFVGSYAPTGSQINLSLKPNIWTDVKTKISNTAITIKPTGMMNNATVDLLAYIVIQIQGINSRNEYIEEEVLINYWSEFVTQEEYIWIDKVKCINSKITYDITIYPYINGREVIWKESITDREEFDRYISLVQFDKDKRQLIWNIIHSESIDFPISYELFKIVKIAGIGSSEEIYDWFIDQDNGLFYVISSTSKLYCYPFIIPKSVNNTLDDIKTIYQSVKIDYLDDSLNEQYIFNIFPTSKTNDVESLDIYINDELYEEGIILDLIRENIRTNRIEIPYSDLFKLKNKALIEFRTSGMQDANFPIFINESELYPIFIKDIYEILPFLDMSSYSNFINPFEKSTKLEYRDYLGGRIFSLNNQSKIYKSSDSGKIIIDGYILENIFKTFYYSEEDNSVIIHNSITNLIDDFDSFLETYDPEDTAIAGSAIPGVAISGLSRLEAPRLGLSLSGVAVSGVAITGQEKLEI